MLVRIVVGCSLFRAYGPTTKRKSKAFLAIFDVFLLASRGKRILQRVLALDIISTPYFQETLKNPEDYSSKIPSCKSTPGF